MKLAHIELPTDKPHTHITVSVEGPGKYGNPWPLGEYGTVLTIERPMGDVQRFWFTADQTGVLVDACQHSRATIELMTRETLGAQGGEVGA
jgi:hypothetical protein